MKKIMYLLLIALTFAIAIFSFAACEKKEMCEECYGDGFIQCATCSGKGFELCYDCDGNGKCSECHGDGVRLDWKTCTNCDGDGFFINPYNWDNVVTCSVCHGLGEWTFEESCDDWRHDDSDGDGKCDSCNGSGINSPKEVCRDCTGSGEVDCPDCEDGYCIID